MDAKLERSQMEDTSELESMAPGQGDAANESAEYAAFVARAVENGSEPDAEDDDEWGEEPVAEDVAADETPEEQATEVSTEGEGEPEATDVQGIDESLKAALKLDGLPDDLIDLMVGTDRDKAIRYALSRKSAQRDVNLAFQERAELKKQAEVSQTDEAEAKAQPSIDVSKLTELLSDELSEEAVGAVVQLTEAMNADLRAELQALKDAQVTTQKSRIQALVSSTRQSLVERFPELADDAAWKSIYESAADLESHRKLAHLDDEGRAKAALEWAARDEYGDPGKASADATPRRNGKGPTPPRRKSPSKPVSSEQREFERWKAKVEGGR